MLAPARHPFGVAPRVIQVPNNRSGARRNLVEDRERIALIDLVSVGPRNDMILVQAPLFHIGEKAFPDARAAARAERMRLLLPVVETPDDIHRVGIGRPDGEVRPFDSIGIDVVRAELFMQAKMAAFVTDTD